LSVVACLLVDSHKFFIPPSNRLKKSVENDIERMQIELIYTFLHDMSGTSSVGKATSEMASKAQEEMMIWATIELAPRFPM
jgi:hypothetical protein